MGRAFIASILLFITLFFCDSCKKTTESQLINGLWQLNTVNLDTSSANFLDKYPNFGNSCCGFKLSFQESDVLFGYYISNDQIQDLYTGSWYVNSYTNVYMKLDSFVDGNFKITRKSLNHWVLISDTNHIALFDNGVNPQFDTSYTLLDMTR